jgi:hypothetical protein
MESFGRSTVNSTLYHNAILQDTCNFIRAMSKAWHKSIRNIDRRDHADDWHAKGSLEKLSWLLFGREKRMICRSGGQQIPLPQSRNAAAR